MELISIDFETILIKNIVMSELIHRYGIFKLLY
jgi:hypothetical protein